MSLGKSSEKKWSQIGKLLLIKGENLPHKKKVFFFFGKFCLTGRIFLASVILSASVERCFVSRMRDFLSLLLKFWFFYLELGKPAYCAYYGAGYVSVAVGIGDSWHVTLYTWLNLLDSFFWIILVRPYFVVFDFLLPDVLPCLCFIQSNWTMGSCSWF